MVGITGQTAILLPSKLIVLLSSSWIGKKMPEGHKTHFLAKQHSDWFVGQTVRVTSPQGRFRQDARKVSGQLLESCTAFGKHLFYEFESGRLIHIHLGRYGKYRILDSPPPKPVGAVRMRLVGDERTIDLTGPTTCRVIDPAMQDQVVAQLGPDPLAGGSKREVWDNIQSSAKPIGALLLDQKILAGVGNIFRAEVLFEIGMHPELTGQEISREEFDLLWKSLIRMMRVGLKYGKIVTVRSSETNVRLNDLEGNDRFRVYGQKCCPRCEAVIETTEIAARKLYWCPQCQAR